MNTFSVAPRSAGRLKLRPLVALTIDETSPNFILQPRKLLSKGGLPEANLAAFTEMVLKGIAGCRVANRPGRIEPRVVKKRPKPYDRMTKPRAVLERKLLNS